jgi:hypothetical protein
MLLYKSNNIIKPKSFLLQRELVNNVLIHTHTATSEWLAGWLAGCWLRSCCLLAQRVWLLPAAAACCLLSLLQLLSVARP